MIDIHCHILPMVDDGSKSIQMSLAMIDSAFRHGTRSMILTPHLAYAYGFDNPTEKIRELFDQFEDIVHHEGIPMDLYLGCEFLYTSKESFKKHFSEITLLNDTKYLLMEFYFDVDEETILEAVDQVLSTGNIPVIAHPERFEAIQMNPDLAKQAVAKGAKLQMNKASLLGNHGRSSYETVLILLENHLISFVGSDAHHPVHRDSKLDESYRICANYFGEEYTYEIFEENPIRYLEIEDHRKEEEEDDFDDDFFDDFD